MRCQEKFDSVLSGQVSAGENVLVAVSGGADSICMAELFLRSSLHPSFSVAHCNFHLRGEESDADEEFVRNWCREHSVDFTCTGFDTLAYASAHGLSVEMAARELRYDWFASVCAERNFSAVAVAHNSNDNAETLVLNLLRGTGLKGLRGMDSSGVVPGHPGVRLLRPMLEFSRDEILGFLQDIGTSHREDRSNSDPAIKRNLIRNGIFPLFAKVNPSAVKTLNREAGLFRQACSIVDDYIGSVTPSVLRDPGEGVLLKVDAKALMALEHSCYVLYRLLEPYAFPSGTASSVIESLGRETSSGKTFHAPRHMLVTSSDSILVVEKGESLSESSDTLVVTGPGTYDFDSCRFTVEVTERNLSMSLAQPRGTLAVDASAIPFPFVARHWREGDWMRPLGLHGRKKLSDMFTDLHFSAVDKAHALVFAPDGETSHVLALSGLRIDESIRVTDKCSKVLIIKNL